MQTPPVAAASSPPIQQGACGDADIAATAQALFAVYDHTVGGVSWREAEKRQRLNAGAAYGTNVGR